MRLLQRLDLALMVQAAALLATVAGIATWGLLLSSSAPMQAQASNEPVPHLAGSGREAAQWFADSPDTVHITLSGLLAGPRGAVAILSIDDAPPRAFLVNEPLADGVRLTRIEGDGVVITRGASESRLSIARLPDSPAMPSLR